MGTAPTIIYIWLPIWRLSVSQHEIMCAHLPFLLLFHLVSIWIAVICVASNVPTVTAAMKKARKMVQYFNKSTQATKKLKDQQHESSLTNYSGQPKNILQDVKTTVEVGV